MKTENAEQETTLGDLAKSLSIRQWCGLIVVLMFAGAILESGNGGNSHFTHDRNVKAMTVAQDAIRQKLKFPSSAQFSEQNVGHLNENEYFYTALVRAENSLGNGVPSSWHVVLVFEPGTDTVRTVISVTQTR